MSVQHPDDIYAMRMMETARLERKRAAERDGIHPGGLVSAKRIGRRPDLAVPRTMAGQIARAIIAEHPMLSAPELSRRSGLSPSACRDIISATREESGMKPLPALSAAGIKAREVLEAEPGISYRELSAKSGLSFTSCRDLIRWHRGGAGKRGPQNGEGGRPRSPEREMADRMAREGRNVSEICTATGLSRETARRAVKSAQREAAA